MMMLESSAPAAAVDEAVALRKVSRRILPWLFVLALLAYLDRANLSFSASELKDDTSIDDFEYGIGGSIFFAGYVIFQLPGTLVARRIGAPAWLTIMTLWGVVAAAFASLCCHRSGDVAIFYVLRFLLGALEAGAFLATHGGSSPCYAVRKRDAGACSSRLGPIAAWCIARGPL